MDIKPSLQFDGGEAFKAALLLLAPLRATLTEEEFEALVSVIKETNSETLRRSFKLAERSGALCVTSGLITRFATSPGMGEASEILSLAARYLDSSQIMPPEVTKWEKAWWMAFVPEAAEDWADDVQDTYNKMVLKTSREYDPLSPPDLLSGEQSAGLRQSLTTTLMTNIQSYTDTGLTPNSGAASGSVPATN